MTAFTTTYFQTLFAYHWHVNTRLLEGAACLAPNDYHAARDYGRGSIHSVLVHLLSADHTYRVALETSMRPPPLDPATLPDLRAVRAGFADEQAAWQALLDRLSPADVEGTITVKFAVPRWHLLQQVILHGHQHHAELAQALTEKGQSPGDTDFIFFV